MGEGRAAGTAFRWGDQRTRHSVITGSRACAAAYRSITTTAKSEHHTDTGPIGPTARTTEPWALTQCRDFGCNLAGVSWGRCGGRGSGWVPAEGGSGRRSTDLDNGSRHPNAVADSSMQVAVVPSTGLVESLLHCEAQGEFGERPGETGWRQRQHRAPGRLNRDHSEKRDSRGSAHKALPRPGGVPRPSAVYPLPQASAPLCR